MNPPELVLFCGGPGSGKSFIIARDWLPRGEFALVDSDAMAQYIYWGELEDRHACAKRIADHMANVLIAAKLPFILHCSGANYSSCAAWLLKGRHAGYKTRIVWVKCSEQTAGQRNKMKPTPARAEFFADRWRLSVANIPRLCELADEVEIVENEDDNIEPFCRDRQIGCQSMNSEIGNVNDSVQGSHNRRGFRSDPAHSEQMPPVYDRESGMGFKEGARSLSDRLAEKFNATSVHGG